MKKILFFACMLMMICTAQPAAANKWRYLLPPLSRSLRHINDQPKVSYSSHPATGSDNPWNYHALYFARRWRIYSLAAL